MKDLSKDMSKGISNFEMEKIFKEINNEDIHETFLDVFLSDNINKYIMFEKMMPGKNTAFQGSTRLFSPNL